MFAPRQRPVHHSPAKDQDPRLSVQQPASEPKPELHMHRSWGNARLQSYGGDAGPRIQRACGCGCRRLSCAAEEDEEGIQTKLIVGPSEDVYEREADRVAGQVVRATEPATATEIAPDLKIRRLPVAASSKGGETDTGLDLSGGRPLSSATRSFMELRFGADFSGVRVHEGLKAQRRVAQLGARAFAYGSHVWLGKGASEGDRSLMAHELTHVVQQGGAEGARGISPTSATSRIQRDPPRQAEPDPCPNGTEIVSFDLVSLNGSNRNPLTDLAVANTAFSQCCVQFQLGTGVSVAPDLSDTWLGGDTDLQREHSGTDEAPVLQTKLVAGAANDRSEREANQVADQVMRTPDVPGNGAQAVSRLTPVGKRVQRRWDEATSRCADQPSDKWIERIVVQQETPQTTTVHWSDGTDESAQSSAGKGHCCVDPASPGGVACTQARSTVTGSNCTPITRRNGYRVRHRDLDHNGVLWWTEFVPSRGIALHEYPRVDGTPLSHGCVRLDHGMAVKIFCGARQNQTWVQVQGFARPMCDHQALRDEWVRDFNWGGQDLSARDGDADSQGSIRETRRMLNAAFGRTLTVDEIRALGPDDIPRCTQSVERSEAEESSSESD